jgi:predicted Na+-dependent transporter
MSAASVAFLALSAVPAVAAARVVPAPRQPAVGFAVALRDFAVAATLATQAFGPRAAAVAGIYGVLMLITGAVASATLRRTAWHPATRRPADDQA